MRQETEKKIRGAYRRIVRNAKEGKGVRLSAEEVEALAEDPMVYRAAENQTRDRR